ncbi:glycoside hydrolase family 73 protein [Lactobacillus paragasseri]|uniref:glycoside hydrolase family 73 protein n=1 Tax=Lactobacillus paragasseri TaxID=2107999 RepID=UPI00217E8E37|nr:glucosaminidase domain-containing protein [Lactobacillus paragasseri]UWI42888.1 glucosaminidase domain-containing protein [Lactobacillus paragasseri]UWI45802.1 glucosaminidase domain-containing protein [Lactobacillus paragasseri]
MKKRTFTGIATAALITTAGISVTNNLKPENPLKTGEGTVQAATYQQEFLNKAIPAATTASSKYGTYTSVMLAQAAVESAWGQSGLAQSPNNNLFGIKGSYNGQSVNMNTGEYGSNGYYTTNAGFRKYPSYTESFEDNGSLLRNQMGNYYSGTWVENSKNYAQATQNGLQGKYATAPNYAQTLNSVIAANGFDKYDPVTQVVNENRTVAQTTPIMSAPVDASVGTQVGTARTGQNVNVTKYITYNNGVKRAYIGTGWINALAFSPLTTNTTTKQNTAANTNNQASQAVKTPVAQTQQVKSQAPAAPVKTATVKAKSAAEVKTPVQATTLNVKTENKAAQPVKQLAVSLAVALKKVEVKKNVVKAEPAKTTPVTTSAKTVVKPVQSYQSAVTTAANNNYGTQWISTNTAPKAASTVLIKVTKTVDVLSAPDGQKLDQQVEAGSEFVVIASKYYNGNLYYEISNGKWIMAKYTTQEAQITAKSGVLTINSKPDYGVPVWRVPGQDQIAGKFLKDGSSWRYFRVANVQGQTWYDLGGNQWVSAKSVLVR